MKRHDANLTPAALDALARGDIDNALTAATPGGIEAQEAAGQATMVAQEILPRDIIGADRAAFEALGFEFGEPHDDLFVNAKLPAGWTKQATDHSMWSRIVDETGNERASIFYKAAFYDRRAFMTLRAED